MPPHKQVPSLQSSTLKLVAYLLRRLCCDWNVSTDKLQSVIDHIQVHIPPQIQALVCRTVLQYSTNKIVFPELLNQKYLMLCTQLHAKYLWINNSQALVPLLKELDGYSVQILKMVGSNSEDIYLESYMYGFQKGAQLEGLYHFLRTLSNLTMLKCSQMCDNYMLEIISQSCPHLEDLSIEMCTDVDDEGVFYLAGHLPTPDTYSRIRRGAQIPSKSVCTKLKKVNFDYTMASTASAVMLLHLCPLVEELNVTPDVKIEDVFTTLHGSDPERYPEVKAKYTLKVIHTYTEIDENELALIVRTCPHLEDVTLRCNGVERKDRNLLANLLSLKIITLNVMNCNMLALLWYLSQRGDHLLSLTIQHLTNSPANLTFTRTHLQKVIQTCPKLQKFTLKLNNNPMQPDLPYSSFGSQMSYFQSLSHLMLEGAAVTPEDLTVLVGKCKKLTELHILIHNLDMLNDQVLYSLLDSGSLESLQTLFLYRPMLTLAGLKRLLDRCPHLHTLGPISSWAIEKKDREALMKEIRLNNWDLNIESPEMMHLIIQ
ncbi:uncharacterized protein LOC127000011 [Eriocheir sinensis]|uniref:uncharacterized protein LOC127000011 n=1 Tax=Eriocheir sinensis TaxID=95602 RepID=UPI0021C7B3BA|nr:uncharacterized protein LOC127000011 [Eriocheir sinensis]